MTLVEEMSAQICARTERQAMDWSLVLASQGIEVGLDREPQGTWLLRVNANDRERAQAAIHRFRQENRGFDWHRELPGSDFHFDGRIVVWAVAVVVLFSFQNHLTAGLFETRAVRHGEWWRSFTAVWMHQDSGHLTSNIALGIVFLGLAMARYGAGVGLLGSLICGGFANYSGLLLRPEQYIGLGASGMIMGALGMIAAQTIPLWRTGRRGTRLMLASMGTGALIFIMTGTSPGSDILVHTIGFGLGLVFGAAAVHVHASRHQLSNRLCLAGFIAMTAISWLLAFTKGS